MGSATVQHVAADSPAIHVAWSQPDRCWWVVGLDGSYGSAATVRQAVTLGRDAAAVTKRPLVIHARDGRIVRRQAGTRALPSPQFFQDDVT